ncbi:MAG: hypothetical protein GF309_16715 [Candidatus Lokiarchaeota archaeon]|jgi:hypothetical protein|nr:hypothetical protein [Candidatus Lokiarchaeota archaeon]
MTYAFVVFYRFKLLSPEESKKAREFWLQFTEEEWPEDIEIVGDFSYAWGSEWNGFLMLQTEEAERFFQFWPKFRDKTRWYVDNTRTIIGLKRTGELMKEQ